MNLVTTAYEMKVADLSPRSDGLIRQDYEPST